MYYDSNVNTIIPFEKYKLNIKNKKICNFHEDAAIQIQIKDILVDSINIEKYYKY